MEYQTKIGMFNFAVAAWCLFAAIYCLVSGSYALSLVNFLLVGLNSSLGYVNAKEFIHSTVIPKLKDRIEFKW